MGLTQICADGKDLQFSLPTLGDDPNNEYAMIDAAVVRRPRAVRGSQKEE